MTRDLPILVVGAGLGGVAAALGLARKGRRVRILEATAELGVIGYGIQLGPNVFRMFRELGVEEAVLKHSHFPPDVMMLDALSGEEVMKVDARAPFRERFGDPYVAIHRVDLHGCLLDACKGLDNVEIMPSTELASFEDLGDRVRATSKDGRVIEGAALIGADGLGSTVRAKLVKEEPPRPIGYVAHRTIVPWDKAPASVRRDEVILWGGPGFHIVQYPLRDKTLFNIVAVFKTPDIHQRADAETYRKVLMETYANAHPSMLEMLAMMDVERRWVLADRDPVRHWSKGRVTMLGDAAHPTLQSYAQGACMAIEDAVVLASSVDAAKGDFETAFRNYENVRYLRAARVVLESRALWEFYHLGGVARDVRNDECKGRSRDDVYKCLAWIYDGVDVATGLATPRAGTP